MLRERQARLLLVLRLLEIRQGEQRVRKRQHQVRLQAPAHHLEQLLILERLR
jgi:hypothetical protein